MSDLKQKLKRVMHSFFADSVTTSSFQFKLEWESYVKNNLLIKIFYRKKIDFNRMGVHLPRLRDSEKKGLSNCSSSSLHLLFMSRITTWKGYPIFAGICDKMASEGTHSVVISNENSRKDIFRMENYNNHKNHYVPNNGIANIKFFSEIVHLYPTNYGSHISYPQSIGMNVLECLALGIPSLISHDNYETWPEFRDNPMVRIVDWQNENEIVEIIKELSKLNQLEKKGHLIILEDAINIKNHVDKILRLSSIEN
jgi:hypothetical protein